METAARDANQELDKLKSLILNHAVVFGVPQPIEDRVADETATRTRRLSEGDIAIDHVALTTPSQGDHQKAYSLLSVPLEHKKRNKPK